MTDQPVYTAEQMRENAALKADHPKSVIEGDK